jgi:TonB family protein
MTRRVVLTAAIIGFVPSLFTLADTRGKCMALDAPVPQYPSLPSGQKPEGEGLFVCHVDLSTGLVTSVSVAKSTGFKILDKAAIDCLNRWKFKVGTCARDVKVPLGFWHQLPKT